MHGGVQDVTDTVDFSHFFFVSYCVYLRFLPLIKVCGFRLVNIFKCGDKSITCSYPGIITEFISIAKLFDMVCAPATVDCTI